jgi:hypothetical protein
MGPFYTETEAGPADGPGKAMHRLLDQSENT